MSLQLYTATNISKKLQGNNLIAVEKATIEVKDQSDSLASLFEDKEGQSTQINPFTADATGTFNFYVEEGIYSLKVTKNLSSTTINIEVVASGVTSIDIETDALTITSADHDILYNISDSTGAVAVTVESVPEENVGMIVFIKSKTESPITLLPGSGVTLESAYALELYAEFSMIAIIYESETTCTIVGDLKQL